MHDLSDKCFALHKWKIIKCCICVIEANLVGNTLNPSLNA